MLHAGHRVDQRVQQTAEIVFGLGVKKWWKPMAAALCVNPGDLDVFIQQALQSEMHATYIDLILTELLMRHADEFDIEKAITVAPNGNKIFALPKEIYALRNLADQYLALHRERPLVIPGAETSDVAFEETESFPRSDSLEWLPVELHAQAKELLDD